MKLPLVSIVISLYNEEGNLVKLFQELFKVETALKDVVTFEYMCVNDGSTDATLQTLQTLTSTYPNINIYWNW